MSFIARLHLRDYRNFVDEVLQFPPQGAAIVGDNAQGKTNLLEAIYYLEIFRSFRGAPDEQLVRFGQDVFRIEAQLGVTGPAAAGAEPERIAAAFDRKQRRKKVTLRDAEPGRLADVIGRLGVTIFSPTDVELVSGAPGARRRFLDIVLSLAVPGYLGALQRYRQTLGQRNALLRRAASAAEVAAWNEGLAATGSRVIAERAEWVRARSASFGDHYARTAGGGGARLDYEPSVAGWPEPAEIAAVFVRELERLVEREAVRGMTLVGPHRDDLRVTGEPGGGGPPVDLRLFGSAGQQRTAAVALRMVEAETIRDTRGYDPIILLDDVFAELDPGRSRRILEWIERGGAGQVILTAPKPADFELRGGSLPRWRMADGRVSEL